MTETDAKPVVLVTGTTGIFGRSVAAALANVCRIVGP